MNITDALANARSIISDPHLDGIADDTRQWLAKDIAVEILRAWDAGYAAGANAQGCEMAEGH